MRLVINNKSMKHIILGLTLFVSPFLVIAHNPLSATYHFEAGKDASVLSINLSQDGVNKILIDKYGSDEMNLISQKKFKELIVDYIKSNFNLTIDEQPIILNKGGIKLGTHQTDLKFVLPPLPNDFTIFHIKIPAFKENGNHQTIFSYKMSGKKDKVILDKKNNYEASIRLSPQVFNSNWLWAILGISLFIGLIVVSRFSKK